MAPTVQAPFRSRVLSVEPAWIDENGHMNQAYYSLLSDRGIGEMMRSLGFGPDYRRTRGVSTMTVESHICFLRELFEGDPVVVDTRVLAVDAKRVHFYAELFHAGEGWRSATSEWLTLSIDMSVRRVAPWPADMRARLDALAMAAASLPPPDRAGRRIAMPAS